MSIATNVGGVWKEGTPDKVNVGGAWKTITVAKVNVGGVWKDVYPTGEVEPTDGITEIRYRPTGNPYELELTAWGGVGPEFDWKMAPFETSYTRGPKVITKVFPTHGDFDAYCTDRGVGYGIDDRVIVEKPTVSLLTDVTWKRTGATWTVEFTAVGGSGTYFWDFDGPDSSTESGGYGGNVMVHKYKSGGYKTVTCTDMGDDANPGNGQQGVKVTIINVSP